MHFRGTLLFIDCTHACQLTAWEPRWGQEDYEPETVEGHVPQDTELSKPVWSREALHARVAGAVKSFMRECEQSRGEDSTHSQPGFSPCCGESKIPQATARATRKMSKTEQNKGLVAPACRTVCDPIDCSPARLPCPSPSPGVSANSHP